MRYNRLKEKKLKMRDIFDTYCSIGDDLWEVNDVVYCDGDFGGQDGPTADPLFMDFKDLDDEEEQLQLYNEYYLSFLELALEQDSFDLFLKFYSYNRCYKVIYSLLNSCRCLKVTQEEDNALHVELPSRPSYEDLEDIKDTFDEVCDVLRSCKR